ncbi:MAG TPA: TspO/MBR family protein [Alphaproteobacteria bacterium]
MTTTKRFLSFLPWLFGMEIISMIIGYLASPNHQNVATQAWYTSLLKAPLNPPSWVFPVVWPILYGLIAYALWRVWTKTAGQRPRSYFLFALGHMILNWGWSFVFFADQKIDLAFIWLLAVLFSALVLAVWTKRYDRTSYLCLVPYVLWLVFAAYLNGYIIAVN